MPLVAAADAAAQKLLLGITSTDITNSTAVGRSVLTAADAAAARTAITAIGAGGATIGDAAWTTSSATTLTATENTRYLLTGNCALTLPVPTDPYAIIMFKAGSSNTITVQSTNVTGFASRMAFTSADGIVTFFWNAATSRWTTDAMTLGLGIVRNVSIGVDCTQTGAATDKVLLPAPPNGYRYYLASLRWYCKTVGTSTAFPTFTLGTTVGGTDVVNAGLITGAPAAFSMSGSTGVTLAGSAWQSAINYRTTVITSSAGFVGGIWILYYLIADPATTV